MFYNRFKNGAAPILTQPHAILVNNVTSRGFFDLRTFEFLLTQTNYQSLVDVLIRCKDTL